MNGVENIYQLEENISSNGMNFFFISKGKTDIVKIVQYLFVEDLNGTKVYNPGFGDYDLEEDIILDDINTNNGDVYKVFNTVLSTIPVFFKNYEHALLMVSGSDGRPDFVESCNITCSKKCMSDCKNFNRRINIYRAYVNKNIEVLALEYQFLGGIKKQDQQMVIERYDPGKKYDSVLLFKK